jgi:hypothetical protein
VIAGFTEFKKTYRKHLPNAFQEIGTHFFMPNFALSTNGNGRRQAIFELLRQTTAGEGSGEEKYRESH